MSFIKTILTFIIYVLVLYLCTHKDKQYTTACDIVDSKKEVGFYCGARAKPTKLVKTFIEKIRQEKYEEIKQLLYSNDQEICEKESVKKNL